MIYVEIERTVTMEHINELRHAVSKLEKDIAYKMDLVCQKYQVGLSIKSYSEMSSTEFTSTAYPIIKLRVEI